MSLKNLVRSLTGPKVHEVTPKLLSINDEELDEGFRMLAQNVGQDVQVLRRFHEDNDLVGSLRQSLLEEKVLDFLIEGSVVREVDGDQLRKEADREVKSKGTRERGEQ